MRGHLTGYTKLSRTRFRDPALLELAKNSVRALVKRERCGCKTRCDDSCPNVADSVECNAANCSADRNCGNRHFADAKACRKPPVWELRHVANKGVGAFAATHIPAGQLIIEYVGEAMSESQVADQVEKYQRSGTPHFYVMALTGSVFVDAGLSGNESRFLNHSCDPNVVTRVIVVGSEPRIGMFALRDIEPGVELCYDYQFKDFGSPMECHCGAAQCRGMLTSAGRADAIRAELSQGRLAERIAAVSNAAAASKQGFDSAALGMPISSHDDQRLPDPSVLAAAGRAGVTAEDRSAWQRLFAMQHFDRLLMFPTTMEELDMAYQRRVALRGGQERGPQACIMPSGERPVPAKWWKRASPAADAVDEPAPLLRCTRHGLHIAQVRRLAELESACAAAGQEAGISAAARVEFLRRAVIAFDDSQRGPCATCRIHVNTDEDRFALCATCHSVVHFKCLPPARQEQVQADSSYVCPLCARSLKRGKLRGSRR